MITFQFEENNHKSFLNNTNKLHFTFHINHIFLKLILFVEIKAFKIIPDIICDKFFYHFISEMSCFFVNIKIIQPFILLQK